MLNCKPQWGLHWAGESPGVWKLSGQFALEPGESVQLPHLQISVAEPNEAISLVETRHAVWRSGLFVHTDRGTQELEAEINLTVQQVDY